MIKFFRKIRQNLVSENKFSKYLIYAFGEIVLVVIGILIALAINNRNQDRILLEKEQTYLKGLKVEFKTSAIKLSKLREVNNTNFSGAKQLLEYIANSDVKPSEEVFSQLLFSTFSYDISFNPNNSLLFEIINSGSLKDISNSELRIRLTNWISTLEDVAKQENELGIQREKVLDIFRTDDYSLRTVFEFTEVCNQLNLPKSDELYSNLELLNSKEFENNILMFILTTSSMEESHYEPLMEELNLILELIDKELNK